MSAESHPFPLSTTCRTCLFFDAANDGRSGDCRRYPPQIVRYESHSSDIIEEYAMLVVMQNFWCGEWASAVQEDEEA